ncbi:MAG: response regulator [Rickettsiales bacterium]
MNILSSNVRWMTAIFSGSSRRWPLRNPYVLKPFNLGKFNEMVHKCLTYHAKLDVLDDHFGLKPVDLSDVELVAEPVAVSPAEMLMREWRILFIDDFHANSEHARLHLEKIGCRLEAATSRDIAWKKIVEAPYDLIFMDTIIDKADGYDLTRHIRRWEEESNIRPCFIVALLDNENEKLNREWLHAGMNDYLIKPCRLGDIEKKVRKFALMALNNKHSKRTG